MKHSMEAVIILTLMMLITLVHINAVLGASKERSVVLTIDQDGIVHAQILTLVSEGLNNITLPTEPIVATVETYINNTLVPSVVINRTLYVFSVGKGVVEVSYIVETEGAEGKFSFKIVTNETVNLTVGGNVILLSLPKNIVDLKISDGNLTIVFTGPETVSYTVAEKPKPLTIAPQTTEAVETQPTITPTTKAEAQEIPWWLIPALLGIVVLGLTLKLLRKPKEQSMAIELSEETRLDDIDSSILKTLAKQGGEMFQSELQKILGIPKATFWRHVMRLAKEGYIEIRKYGKMNKLILKRRPKWET